MKDSCHSALNLRRNT